MKILVIGSGGREHAIVHKLSMSGRKPQLYAAPGNAGIAQYATCVNIPVDHLDDLLSFALKESIDLTIVGPEVPLVMGIVDLFEANQLKIFGPNQMAAQFEGSKEFTKAFLMKHGIPTARYETYTDLDEAIKALDHFDLPVVIKADGLAAGKGVVIALDKETAIVALNDMMADKVFGESGSRVVIEAYLTGVEASVLCFVDGKTILPMQPAQDYKKAFDGDLGPNTGGMGTYSPSCFIDEKRMNRIQLDILDPFIRGIQEDGIAFKGVLFVGLMIEENEINVLEYNVRLGDPETEVTLIRMKNDLIDVIEAILNERLERVSLEWIDESAVCVILSSGGYPEAYEKGHLISGLETLNCDNVQVYHCGTSMKNGEVITSGGRVLGVTALGENLEVARQKAYEGVDHIQFSGMAYRKDIGQMES